MAHDLVGNIVHTISSNSAFGSKQCSDELEQFASGALSGIVTREAGKAAMSDHAATVVSLALRGNETTKANTIRAIASASELPSTKRIFLRLTVEASVDLTLSCFGISALDGDGSLVDLVDSPDLVVRRHAAMSILSIAASSAASASESATRLRLVEKLSGLLGDGDDETVDAAGKALVAIMHANAPSRKRVKAAVAASGSAVKRSLVKFP